jgi:hypothetical protein
MWKEVAMPNPDKNAFPVFVIAAFVGLAVVLMLWALVQTNGPTSMDVSKKGFQSTGSISSQSAVPAPPAPRNDAAWDSYRGAEVPQSKSR